MSYLELPTGLADFSKTVISLWFRVPASTLAAIMETPDIPDHAEFDSIAWGVFYPALTRVIPLVTFGSVEVARSDIYASSGSYPTSPSFVGVNCASGIATLAVNLQMSNNAVFSAPPFDTHAPIRRDAFFMAGRRRPSPDADDAVSLTVTPDHWHHALISFDISLSCSWHQAGSGGGTSEITPGPTFTWAFDDRAAVDLSMAPSGGANWPPIPLDAIITQNLTVVLSVADAGKTATWNPVGIKSHGNSVATPTAAQFVGSVYPVELAELQFFTGVTLDARIEANRRAFIDADGEPVAPIPSLDDPDDPTSPMHSPAERLLGQPPDILLHGSGNWIVGKNTGPPMIDNPDYDPSQPVSSTNPLQIPDPDFQFTPTGQIVSYTPDPSLHGPQSPDPPPAVRLQRRIRVPA